MTSKRVLLTGLSTYWGGRLAASLEQDPSIEAIIGIDATPPKVELERVEFVQVANYHTHIRRIVEAAEIDTVVDTRIVADSAVTSPRKAHENNIIGTMNILAGCSGEDSPVRKLVFKSSAHYYGCEQDDPGFFREEMRRPHPAHSLLEKDIVEAERAVADFATRDTDVTVTVLRFVNGIGEGPRTTHMQWLSQPMIPAILGFDPRFQYVHLDDIVGALEHAVTNDIPGIFNVAADGVLVLSEIADLLGKRLAPVIPPVGTDVFARQVLSRLGLRLTPELLQLMRYGRALDNRRLKATGFEYRYTTREAVLQLRKDLRTARLRQGQEQRYVYEKEIEHFLNRSQHVRRRRPSALASGDGANGGPLAAYDDLRADEVIAALGSLEPGALEELRRYEAEHRARRTVLGAIDRHLTRAR